MTSLLGRFVEIAYEIHALAGDGHLTALQVHDAALDILTDIATETP